MTGQRMNRWMGLLGLAILVLFFVGFGPLSGISPKENASGLSVVAYWNAHQTIGWLQIPVIGLGLAMMVLFVSQLRDVLRDAADDLGPLPSVVYAAGIIFVSDLVVAGALLHIPLLLAAHNHQTSIAQTLNFVGLNNELLLLFGMALLTLATGIAILTGSLLPKWLGWVSVVVGLVCCAGPLSFFGFLAGGIWLPVLGFVIRAKTKTSALPA
ncbi:MAG TPA: hypothetical protein VMU99_09525 [Acidimicrobiales bacterium]|nr:hypothetical protein [Acidimicrobiales bacterium]